jgi:nitrite reductase/ring-hydroxylating ferredoxin subunit
MTTAFSRIRWKEAVMTVDTTTVESAWAPSAARRRHRNPVPAEGTDGLYTQSWFAVCRSEDIPPGGVLGREFLGGRVVVYRGVDGKVRVQSAFCPHLGADLSLGKIVGDTLACPFHGWEYDGTGRCVRTGIGDPPPPNAMLFNFPVREAYGVVFAFNGREPLYELDMMDVPSDQAVTQVSILPMKTDPWTFCANVPDFQHFPPVHRTLRDDIGHYDRIRWHDYGLSFEFTAYLEHGRGATVPFKVSVLGTSLIYVQSFLPDGRWIGTIAAMSMPRPRYTDIHIVVAIRKGDGSAQTQMAEKETLALLTDRFLAMAREDHELLETAHYTPGHLSRHDQALARYLDMVRNFPRANPAAEFIT